MLLRCGRPLCCLSFTVIPDCLHLYAPREPWWCHSSYTQRPAPPLFMRKVTKPVAFNSFNQYFQQWRDNTIRCAGINYTARRYVKRFWISRGTFAQGFELSTYENTFNCYFPLNTFSLRLNVLPWSFYHNDSYHYYWCCRRCHHPQLYL